MFTRIIAVAALVLALMAVVKDGRVLRQTGVVGSCMALQTTIDGIQYEACRPGKIAGAPSLAGRGCSRAGEAGPLEYWQCPPHRFARQADSGS